ncbi:hypothetical protein SK571_33680 [Lentzea sp. BCCO 10_0798]|uniref:DUF6973 domain-containing protein n=1 Tax=Lentzea kristufekii TaxID=3095430 RepID=A0ABU4U197_9PSEU|nr:hypothetical protein [Lentzea sp. BCCO 10_0798]MDX8054348.1 hypothetical protein [Lentzea sp. BCCO 10_0798]
MREWDARPLDEMMTRLDRSIGQLRAVLDDFLRRQPFKSWASASAELAAARQRELVERLERIEEAMIQIRRTLSETKHRVLKLRCQVRRAEDLATEKGFRIQDDGEVVPKADLSSFLDLIKGGGPFAYYEVKGHVEAILTEAVDLDVDSSKQFGRAAAMARDNAFDETLLRDFHVSEDSREPGFQGFLWNLLPVSDFNHVEADLFFGLTDAEKIVAGWIKHHSEQVAIDLFADKGGDGAYYGYYESGVVADNKADAFRHAYASALLAHHISPEFSERFTTAHEQSGGNSATAHAMDLHNNAVGREIAINSPHATTEQLATLVRSAVMNGELAVISAAGDLVRSNDTICRPEAPGVDRPRQVW